MITMLKKLLALSPLVLPACMIWFLFLRNPPEWVAYDGVEFVSERFSVHTSYISHAEIIIHREQPIEGPLYVFFTIPLAAKIPEFAKETLQLMRVDTHTGDVYGIAPFDEAFYEELGFDVNGSEVWQNQTGDWLFVDDDVRFFWVRTFR